MVGTLEAFKTQDQVQSDPWFAKLQERHNLTEKQIHVVSSYLLPNGRVLLRLGAETVAVLPADSLAADRANWFGSINLSKARRLYGLQEGGRFLPEANGKAGNRKASKPSGESDRKAKPRESRIFKP